MVDPIISLAFSIHSNRGIYALLLGSGVSRSAGIPTGWEITLDLTRKLAKTQKEDCGPDPAAWYKGCYHDEPDYAKLIDLLAKKAGKNSLVPAGIMSTSASKKRDRATENSLTWMHRIDRIKPFIPFILYIHVHFDVKCEG